MGIVFSMMPIKVYNMFFFPGEVGYVEAASCACEIAVLAPQ